MKKITLPIVVLMIAFSVQSQDDVLIYGDGVEGIVWSNFAGPTNVQIVDNPLKDNTNPTATCISINRPKETGNSDEIGWPFEGAMSSSFDITNIQEFNTLSMLVKKPYPGKVCVEFIGPSGGSSMIYAEYTATDDSWQKLTFPVINVAGIGKFETMLLEIHRENENNNPDFDDCVMYADEIILHKAMPPFYFNGEDKMTGGWLPFPSDEFSYLAKIVENPDKSGINDSDKCLWIKRQKSDPPFAGAINRNFKVVDLANYDHLEMMVKKSVEGPVTLEIQSPQEAHKEFLTASYTDVNNWQKLIFPIPENALNGEPLQIIILQAHALETSNDDNFPEFIDIYVDELYLNNTSQVPTIETGKYKIVYTEIYNIEGQILRKYSSDSFDYRTLAPGIYILKQIDEVGNVITKKIANK